MLGRFRTSTCAQQISFSRADVVSPLPVACRCSGPPADLLGQKPGQAQASHPHSTMRLAWRSAAQLTQAHHADGALPGPVLPVAWHMAQGRSQMHTDGTANKGGAASIGKYAIAAAAAVAGLVSSVYADSSSASTAGARRREVPAATHASSEKEAAKAKQAAASDTGGGKNPKQHAGHEEHESVLDNPSHDHEESHRRHWYSPLGRLFYHGHQNGNENPYKISSPNAVHDAEGLLIVPGNMSKAPGVPPPCIRDYPVHMVVDLETTSATLPVSLLHKYPFWTYNGTVPGPMIRCRVGDVLEVRYANKDADGIGHNIDFHAVVGPGGGSAVTYCESGDVKVATFKMLHPGLFIYHCAAAPVPVHIGNGMYGLVLVEPADGMLPVDREFYVVQSEVYGEESEESKDVLDPSYNLGLVEHPTYVVFNGAANALTEKGPLQAEQGERVRIYFGNAGPNLVSSFHVIGAIFDKVYREGDLVSPPARSVQTTLVPAGGSTVVEMDLPVPGNFTLVDHSIFRIDKGAIGFLKVKPRGGDRRRDIYDSAEPPAPCPGCKLHN